MSVFITHSGISVNFYKEKEMKYKNIVKISSKFLIFCFLLEMENGKSYIIAVPILEDTWRNKYD